MRGSSSTSSSAFRASRSDSSSSPPPEHPEFLSRSPVDLERLIVETATALERYGGQALAGAARRWDGALSGDEERLQTTLDALIENAVKFTDENDRIEIVGRSEGSLAVIDVSDTGVGIPPDQLTRIFDRFSRVDEGLRRRNGHGGTGLGLPIVEAIVEAHGGTVQVRSEVGHGTTFSLRIPGFRSGAESFDEPSALDANAALSA